LAKPPVRFFISEGGETKIEAEVEFLFFVFFFSRPSEQKTEQKKKARGSKFYHGGLFFHHAVFAPFCGSQEVFFLFLGWREKKEKETSIPGPFSPPISPML
jgi:hypothetical protein